MQKSWEAALAAVAGVLILVGIPVLFIASPAPAQSDVSVPGVTVTLPPVTAYVPLPVPGPTVVIPGATIKVPGPTIRVPGPTTTVTVTAPGEPVTKTVTASATETVTASQNATQRPTQAPTNEDTISGAGSPGQSVPDDDTIASDPPGTNTVYSDKEIITTVTTGVVLLFILALLGLYFGYVLGYKDRERDERNFLIALRDQMLGKKIG